MPLSGASAKKAGSLRDKVMKHRQFLKERRAGLTDKQTRKSSDINKGAGYSAGTVTSRRRKNLEKVMRNY